MRGDISDWLWHFVKRDNAQETLTGILTDRKLQANEDRDTGETIVCLTEAPVYEFMKQSPYSNEQGTSA